MIPSLTISLIVLFLHATTWEGHIFEGIKKIIPPKGKLYKPIYGCPICMSIWYGSAIYAVLYRVSLIDGIVTVFTAAGFSVIWALLISIKDWIKKISTP